MGFLVGEFPPLVRNEKVAKFPPAINKLMKEVRMGFAHLAYRPRLIMSYYS